VSQRLVFVQSDRWYKRFAGTDAGMGVYSDALCAYCARPVRPDATRLYTARTNDGEWWLVSADEDLKTDEWRDFQTMPNGSRLPTLLPIGPDCLRDHPEFAFAVAKYGPLDFPDVVGSGKGHLYTREVSEQRAARRKEPQCEHGNHLGPVRWRQTHLPFCERCGKDIPPTILARERFAEDSPTICTWPIDGRAPSKQARPCNRTDCPHCRSGRTS